ncbi:MAG: hypothetical protein AABX10_01800 [Nanoarchaeota archaeon]
MSRVKLTEVYDCLDYNSITEDELTRRIASARGLPSTAPKGLLKRILFYLRSPSTFSQELKLDFLRSNGFIEFNDTYSSSEGNKRTYRKSPDKTRADLEAMLPVGFVY